MFFVSYILDFILYLYIFCHTSWHIGSSSLTRNGTVEVQSPNQWAMREVPSLCLRFIFNSSFNMIVTFYFLPLNN